MTFQLNERLSTFRSDVADIAKEIVKDQFEINKVKRAGGPKAVKAYIADLFTKNKFIYPIKKIVSVS